VGYPYLRVYAVPRQGQTGLRRQLQKQQKSIQKTIMGSNYLLLGFPCFFVDLSL
jgi:hypothetical protein